MTQKNLNKIKNKALPILKNAGVIRSALFGSYASGKNRKNSDVDLLVDLPRGISLFDLADLQNKLEKALKNKVDLVTYNSLHPLLRNKILEEQIAIL